MSILKNETYLPAENVPKFKEAIVHLTFKGQAHIKF